MILKKAILILAGTMFLVLGVVGVVVPGLPTTPFLLLTLACYTRSSSKLTEWFMSTYLYKKFLANYVRDKSLTIRQKVCIMLMSNSMMIFTFVFAESVVLRVAMVVCLIVHDYVIIVRIKTRNLEGDKV